MSAGQQRFQPLLGLGAGDEQLAHMADVEQAGAIRASSDARR